LIKNNIDQLDEEVKGMFRVILINELKKLFIRRNITILGILFILLAFLCGDGISDYKQIVTNKKQFQEMERDKVQMYLNYTVYGVRGIRLLFIPDPLSVIFNDSAVFDGMVSHLDSAEMLNISNSLKGKDLFSDSGGFMDFSGIMLLISLFIALIYGWDSTRNSNYLHFISDISGCSTPGLLIILARIIILNLISWILCSLNFVWMLANGIVVSNIFYLTYILILTLAITSFVVAGGIVGSLKSNVIQFVTLPLIYFLLVLLIPWLLHRVVYMEAKDGMKSIFELEYQSYKYMMTFKKRFYNPFEIRKSGETTPDSIKAMIQSGQEVEYKKLREAELQRIEEIAKRINVFQTLSSLLPTTFYISTNKELSSKGFQNFIAFYRYSYNMKQDFIKFYINCMFYKPLPQNGVGSFIKGNENLFYGKSQLPKSFGLGLALVLIYIAVLLVILYRMQAKSKCIETEKLKTVEIDFNKGNPLFALCRDEKMKGEVFQYYQQQKNSACIEKMPADFSYQLNALNGIKTKEVFNFLCSITRANREKASKYLSILGIQNLNIQRLEREDILKFYAAVKIARNDIELVVFNDFFKQTSRELETDFFKLLSNLETSGQKILYLSCNMYYPQKKYNEKMQIDTFCLLPLPTDEVTLR
jgi:hypothetical protein